WGKVELCRAVTIGRSAKAALLELSHIVVEVGGREPIRKWIWIGETIEIFRVGRLLRPWAGLEAFAGGVIVDLPKRRAHVRLELRFRHARLLEIELIEEAILVEVLE